MTQRFLPYLKITLMTTMTLREKRWPQQDMNNGIMAVRMCIIT